MNRQEQIKSLYQIALLQCIDHARDLSVDALSTFPDAAFDVLCEKLVRNDASSFTVWKKCISAVIKRHGIDEKITIDTKTKTNRLSCPRWRIPDFDRHLETLAIPLLEFLPQFNAPQAEWLVLLHLCNVDISYNDLLRLHRLTNLSCLMLEQDVRIDGTVSKEGNQSMMEEIIHLWGKSARAQKKDLMFPHLQCIAWRWTTRDKDMARLLTSLENLPSIKSIVCTTSKRNDSTIPKVAETEQWKRVTLPGSMWAEEIKTNFKARFSDRQIKLFDLPSLSCPKALFIIGELAELRQGHARFSKIYLRQKQCLDKTKDTRQIGENGKSIRESMESVSSMEPTQRSRGDEISVVKKARLSMSADSEKTLQGLHGGKAAQHLLSTGARKTRQGRQCDLGATMEEYRC